MKRILMLAALALIWLGVVIVGCAFFGCREKPIPDVVQLHRAATVPHTLNAHWKRGHYWNFDPKSVRDLYVRDEDGAALVTVSYANPSSTETWSVCSAVTGDCYGAFETQKDAERKAISVAKDIDQAHPARKDGE